MMSPLPAENVLALSRASLNLPAASAGSRLLDDEFLSAMLRRIAGLHCPCSSKTLKAVLFQSLEGLVTDGVELSDHVDSVLEGLHAGGDLLELSRVTTLDERTRGTWVYVAPPSFVVLPSGLAMLFGMAPEESLPLPNGLRTRVRSVGSRRILEPQIGEDLRALLADAGLREQSVDGWLQLPQAIPAREFLKAMDARLSAISSSGSIDQLRIFDPALGAKRYAERWIPPSKQSGRFVSRRAQAFGSDLWGYVELVDGEPRRVLDFPLPGSTYRGCDDAWRLQLALDKESGHPQEYRIRIDEHGTKLDLFAPVPLWAQRRLEVVGTRITPQRCLMAFWLRPDDVEEECQFLDGALWMQRSAGGPV